MKGQPEKPRAVLSPRAAHISSAMSMKREREGGFAIITAISFMVVVGVMVSTALLLGYSNRIRSADTVSTTQAQTAAESGIDQALLQVYANPLLKLNKDQRSLNIYRNRLNSFASYTNVSPVGGKLTDGTTLTFTGPDYKVEVTRKDETITRNNEENVQTLLVINSVGTVKRPDGSEVAQRNLKQTIYMTPNDIKLDFALLSNNVNCSFCHTRIETMKAAYGSTAVGTDRVKAGTLQELEIRFNDSSWDSTDTVIGGTLYTRGRFVDQYRTDLTTANINAATNKDIVTYPVDSVTGKITSDTPVNVNVQDCNVLGQCAPRNNFYTNYPKNPTDAKDGPLPSNFPLPIADNDGDRVIDQSEWEEDLAFYKARQGGNYGTLAARPGGSIIINKTVWTQANPTSLTNTNADFTVSELISGSRSTATSTDLQGTTKGIEGNLIIAGAFNLNGVVFVSGDLVMRNTKLHGKGRLVVRGNIYVTGDVEYQCGSLVAAIPCTSNDLKTPESLPSLLALVAGGNILIGDYITGTWASRDTLKDSGQRSSWNSFSFTHGQVSNFNRAERNIRNADPSYRPRYYRFNELDAAKLYYNNDNAREAAGSLGETNEVEATNVTESVTVTLGPTGNWLSEQQIKQMWIDDIETPVRTLYKFPFQPKDGFLPCSAPATYAIGSCEVKPLRIDATLYSANAIFALVRGSTNTQAFDTSVPPKRIPRSNVDGRLFLNGSIISPDLGVMAPGSEGKKDKQYAMMASGGTIRPPGFRLMYDPRAKSFLNRPGSGLLLPLIRSYYRLEGK